jgi:DNA-binding transcriptional LysR family regulator
MAVMAALVRRAGLPAAAAPALALFQLRAPDRAGRPGYQGLALARLPLVADALASGDLVEVLPGTRLDSPLAYWLLLGPRSRQRPEAQAFTAWLRQEAGATRRFLGEGSEDADQA